MPATPTDDARCPPRQPGLTRRTRARAYRVHPVHGERQRDGVDRGATSSTGFFRPIRSAGEDGHAVLAWRTTPAATSAAMRSAPRPPPGGTAWVAAPGGRGGRGGGAGVRLSRGAGAACGDSFPDRRAPRATTWGCAA